MSGTDFRPLETINHDHDATKTQHQAPPSTQKKPSKISQAARKTYRWPGISLMTHPSAYITLYPRSNYHTLSTLVVVDSSSLRNHYPIPQYLIWTPQKPQTPELFCWVMSGDVCSGIVVYPSCIVVQLENHALRYLPCFCGSVVGGVD